MIDYTEVLTEIIDEAAVDISDIKPSEWYEKNMIMPRGSAFPGPFSFDRTPYWREPLDCAHKSHPAKEVTIMKGAQVGGTAAVLNPLVGYTIAQNPGNTMFLTGHADLSDEMMSRIDIMIDSCDIRHLIRPNALKAKSRKSGDTIKQKEFPGGYLISGSVTNHNLLRQRDIMVMIVDDFDAAPMSAKGTGSTRELVQKRTSAYAHKRKLYYVSSPQMKGSSNIEACFLNSDQRYYFVPCPCCSEMIRLEWKVQVDERNTAGITWKTDNHGRLIEGSVGYICQKCGKFFTSEHKYEMNLNGEWRPTEVNPVEQHHYGYHLSSLYSPPGMDDWDFYVRQYLKANPDNGERNEARHQAFLNTVLGKTYEFKTKRTDSTAISMNTRNYLPGVVPNNMSIADGNDEIVLLTCAADLNGYDNDARLDYEVLAWSKSGSTYSIDAGSIGTFINLEFRKKEKEDRAQWTYYHTGERSVWSEFRKVIDRDYITDSGRTMKVFLTAVDAGNFTQWVYDFLETTPDSVIGVKGESVKKYVQLSDKARWFKQSQNRPDLQIVKVNQYKDYLADLMQKRWKSTDGDDQPADFMNFPTPTEGKYTVKNYFSHFESEERKVKMTGDVAKVKWQKKNSASQNHFWDVRIYNLFLRDYFIHTMRKELKMYNASWSDLIEAIFS